MCGTLHSLLGSVCLFFFLSAAIDKTSRAKQLLLVFFERLAATLREEVQGPMIRGSFQPLTTAPILIQLSTYTRGVMLRHDRTEGWLEILGAVSSDP